jgi:hypothetical protein
VLGETLGIRLLLWAGNPLPTPRPDLLTPLRAAEVTLDASSVDGFQLSFAVTKGLLGRFDVIDTLAPGTRVWIGVAIGIIPQPLIDGVVERHDLAPSDRPGASTLTVTGTGVSSLLGLRERTQPYPNQPDSLIVTTALARYPDLGLVPQVTPTTKVPIEVDLTPQQQETDLALVTRLAEENGFVFFTEPLTFGVNRAYWGPQLRGGPPQARLTLGMGSHRNVRDLSFSCDSLAPEGWEGSFVDPFLKQQIPVPATPALRIPPLAARPTLPRRTRVLREVSNKGPIDAMLAAQAQATRASESVTGQGTLDTVRYGSILRARGLVGVRGAGVDYDGQYYVTRVTHSISRGDYTQSFGLSRDGTISLTPVVVP